jgi:hypothetical protein
MGQQDEIMDNLLNVDLEIIDVVRSLHQEDWDSETLKIQIVDLLKIRDEMVVKLMSLKENNSSCDCGHDNC